MRRSAASAWLALSLLANQALGAAINSGSASSAPVQHTSRPVSKPVPSITTTTTVAQGSSPLETPTSTSSQSSSGPSSVIVVPLPSGGSSSNTQTAPTSPSDPGTTPTTTTSTIQSSENGAPPIVTSPPGTPVITGTEVSSRVSTVSLEIESLIPVLSAWEATPTPLQSDTITEVEDVIEDVKSLITDLGGDPSSSGCIPSPKGGLLGLISNIVGTLSCIAKDLGRIRELILVPNVPGVADLVPDLVKNNNNLKDNENNGSSNSESSSSPDTLTSASTDTNTMSTPSTPSSSCSPTTALQVTVLCSPTTFTTGSTRITTSTCTPSTTVTATGCSVTGGTTTISSTASPSPTAAPNVCSPETCGDSCPMEQQPLSASDLGWVERTYDCTAIPTLAASAEPPSEDSVKRALAISGVGSGTGGLVERVLRPVPGTGGPHVGGYLSPNAQWVSQQGDTSGHWFDFPLDQGFIGGVNGIYGCTAVVIISNKGVYLSHIWEVPVFLIPNTWKETRETWFVRKSLDALRNGNPNVRGLQSLIGSDANPGVLHPSNNPAVFVISPFTSAYERQNFNIQTPLRYQARAERIRQELVALLPAQLGDRGRLLGYTRTSEQASTTQQEFAGRAIVEADAYEYFQGPFPDGRFNQYGALRLWVENQIVFYTPYLVQSVRPAQPPIGAPINPLRLRRDDSAAACLPSIPTTTSPSPTFILPTGIPTTLTTTTTTGPAVSAPTETAGNNEGSPLCTQLGGGCSLAYTLFEDWYTYDTPTTYVAVMGDELPGFSPLPLLPLPLPRLGCAASFHCTGFGVSMTGWEIKQAVEHMFVSDDVQECGSTYLSNSCQITLDACVGEECAPRIPCGALPLGSDQDCYSIA